MHGFLKQSTATQARIVGPFVDDTDFKTLETALTIANTDVKLSKNGAVVTNKNSGGGTHVANGMYSFTFDATDTNTVGELSGSISVTGALVVPFKFTVLEEAIYDALFNLNAGAFDANQRVDVGSWLGTAVATPTVAGVPEVDITHMAGGTQTVTDLKDFADAGYDPITNKVQGVVLTDTVTTLAGHTAQTADHTANISAILTDTAEIGVAGAGLTNINLPDQTMNITGNLSGSVGSVSGHTPQTGDNYARLGAPAGASVSADISAVKAETNSLDGTKIPDVISLANLNMYRNNAVWIDTVNGSAGTTAWINGTENNPSNTITDALTIASARGIKNFMIANGSSITLASTFINYNFIGIASGVSWTLALGGQNVSGSTFLGADISGIGSGSSTVHFDSCDFVNCTIPPSEIKNSGLEGDLVLGSAGNYFFIQCYSEEGGAIPSIDFGGSVLNNTVNMWLNSGPIEIRNLGQSGSDNLSIEGTGHLILASTCAGGTVNLRGSFQKTDNVVGGFLGTLNAVGIAGTVTSLDSLQTNLKGSLGASVDMTKMVQKDTGGAFTPDAHSNEALRERGDVAWITGGGGGITDILQPVPLIPKSIDLANTATFRFGFMLTNQVDNLPSVIEITPGTISIERKAIGGTTWVSIVNNVACSEAPGLIFFDEVFDSATGYAEGDSIRITLKNQKITVSANDYEITDATGQFFYSEIRQTMKGTNGALTDKNNFNLASNQASVTIGTVTTLTGHTPQTGDNYARLGAPAGVSVSADNASIKSDSSAIKLKTDNLPDGIRKNQALNNFKFFMVLSSDHVTGATGLAITSTIQRDAGSFGATTNTAVEIGQGWYRLNLTASDLNADSVALSFSGSGADTRIISIPRLET